MQAIGSWRRRVLWGDLIGFGLFFAVLITLTVKAGYWQGLSFQPFWLEPGQTNPAVLFLVLAGHVLALLGIHYGVRRLAAAGISPRGDLVRAFLRNTKPWRSIFARTPVGWGRFARKRLKRVLEDTDTYVQTLNDRFTNPSGEDMVSVQNEPMRPPVATEPAAAEATPSSEAPRDPS